MRKQNRSLSLSACKSHLGVRFSDGAKTMKAVELTEPSLTAFRHTILPDPRPGNGEVLVRLHAAALNFIDVAIATGKFPGAKFPMVPVADGAGEVVALGEGVS